MSAAKPATPEAASAHGTGVESERSTSQRCGAHRKGRETWRDESAGKAPPR